MQRAIDILIIAVFVFFVISFALTPIRSDNDVWWHVKTGRIITETRALPTNDILAFTSENIPWHNHEWLSQVIFWEVFTLGDGSEQSGFRMVVLLTALLLLGMGLLVAWLAWRETGSVPIALLAGVWAVLLSRRTIYPRPPVFTYFFFAGALFLLREVDTGRIKRKWLWILPPVMIIWTNLHGGFLIGLIAVGAYMASEAASAILNRKPLRETKAYFYAVILGACVVATLINPYGLNLYLLPLRVMSDKSLVRIIFELHSPDFYFMVPFEILILFCIGAFAVSKKKTMTLAEGMLLVFFLHQSIQHVRHVPLVGIVAAPICARIIAILAEEWTPEKLKHRLPALFSAAAILLIGWTLLNHREGESFLDRNRRFMRGEGYYVSSYPVAEANFIMANEFTGRMFNQINVAGFLIWRLSPEHYKVFTDSRFDIFGGQFMRQEQIIQDGIDLKNYPDDDTWDELLDRWKVNFILITADAPVNDLLTKSGHWEEVYHRLPQGARSSREGYKIYIRKLPENQPLIDRCRRSFETLSRQLTVPRR